MLSALWDYGTWDNILWDTLVCEITTSWTSDDDLWAANLNLYHKFVVINADFSDSPDQWVVDLTIRQPGVSYWNEKRDIWDALIYITLHPPIYSAGGGWWINVWGERLPNWKERRKNLENAYSSWRYKIQGAWTSKDSTWGATVQLASIPEERLQQQIKLMFGSWEPYDEDEDLLWLM